MLLSSEVLYKVVKEKTSTILLLKIEWLFISKSTCNKFM